MLGPRKSHTGVFTKTPVVTVGAYSANDVVGGLLKLDGAAGGYGNAVIQSIVTKDNANQKKALTLLFFRAAPTGIPADNGAMTLSAADMAKCIGKVNIAATDYETVDTKAIATVYPGLVVTATNPEGDIWMVVVATTAPTFAAVDDLTFEVGTLQD